MELLKSFWLRLGLPLEAELGLGSYVGQMLSSEWGEAEGLGSNKVCMLSLRS